MKATKYFIGMAIALAGFAATSCDTDAIGPKYESPTQAVSMQDAAASVATDDAAASATVRFIRAKGDASYTLNYTGVASEGAQITDEGNGSVTFAAGETVKDVKVSITGMEPGQSYTYTITLSDADVATADTVTNSAISQQVLTFSRNYIWEDAGTCTFVDRFFSDDEEGTAVENVAVIHAQSTNLYRLVNPFAYIQVAGNMTFYLDDNGNAAGLPAGWGDRFSGYWILWDTTNYADYCTFTNDGDHFVANFLVSNDKSSLYLAGWDIKNWTGWPGTK